VVPRRVIGVTAGVLGVVVVAVLLLVQGPGPEDPARRLIWVTEKTPAAPGALPAGLVDAAHEASAARGGELVAYAVGRLAEPLPVLSLDVVQNGDVVQDPDRRAVVLDRRLAGLVEQLAAAPVGGDGFSLYAALRAIADEADRSGPLEVWLSTTVLSSTVDPFRVPALTVADPDAAVAELMRGELARLDLRDVVLQPVLLAPVGPGQEPLTAIDEAWRADFVTGLGAALGARVLPPVRSDTGDPPWPASSVVPPVVPLPDPTPELGACAAQRCVIDTLAFHPNSPDLIDEDAATRQVAEFVAALPAGAGPAIRVAGFTAAVGDAGSSRELARDRAERIADLLRAAGVTRELVIEGVGFDRLADPSRPPVDPAQRVVVLSVEPTA
jgi:outer membrane protein OmpA-like peptidoglycan-associated protein